MNINPESNLYKVLEDCIYNIKTGETEIKEWKAYIKMAKTTFRAHVKAAKISEPGFPAFKEAYAFMLSEYERKNPATQDNTALPDQDNTATSTQDNTALPDQDNAALPYQDDDPTLDQEMEG